MSEFFSMGGYGFYIWSCFAIALVLMLGEVFMLKKQRKETLQTIKRIIKMNQSQS